MAFLVVEVPKVGPRVLRQVVRFRQGALVTTASTGSLELLGVVSLEEWGQLVHFDPWWVFRGRGFERAQTLARRFGRSYLDRAWLDAIKASNVATTFMHAGARHGIRDLVFDADLRRLVSIEAQHGIGAGTTFRYGDVDVMALRLDAQARQR